jgi:hypothetical protein
MASCRENETSTSDKGRADRVWGRLRRHSLRRTNADFDGVDTVRAHEMTSQLDDDEWIRDCLLVMPFMSNRKLIEIRGNAELRFDCGDRYEARLARDRLVYAWINAELARRD